MKQFILICSLVLCGFASFAQDDSNAQDSCQLTRGTDEFSNGPKLSTGFLNLSDVQFNIDANGKEFDLFFLIKNPAANCIGDNSEALFVFEGGKQKMMLKNTGGDNCNGFFHIIMRGGQFTPGNLTKLATKKVVSITFTDRNEKKTIVVLSPDQQEALMRMSKCIADQARTLLK